MKAILLSLVMMAAIPAAIVAADSPVSKPTREQADWQDLEIGMMISFDIPIYTEGSRGNCVNWKSCGHLGPDVFNPRKLDTDQWMEAARALGAKYTVFVAKHCSGFILWQSDAYPYGLKQCKWRNGKGDILRDYVESSKRAGILPGLYVSWPANGFFGVNSGKVNLGKGGAPAKQAQYVNAYERLVTEAYGNYGKFCEIWFDGSVTPPDRGGPDAAGLLKRLQPQAVVFQGPSVNSIRWVGNESGIAPDPCWATVVHRGQCGRGDPKGTVWSPAECDVPVRNHDWFWQPNAEHKLYSLDQLMNMYYQSVGRNANLLLNATPDRDGLVPRADMKRYREFAAEIRRRFGKSLAETTGHGDTVSLKLAKPTWIDHVILMEDIRQGERIREFAVEGLVGGQWQTLCKAECVGHKRIDRFARVEVSEVRLRVTKSVAPPVIRRLAVFDVAGTSH